MMKQQKRLNDDKSNKITKKSGSNKDQSIMANKVMDTNLVNGGDGTKNTHQIEKTY